MQEAAACGFEGVEGSGVFLVATPGEVGGVDDNPGVVKGLLAGVWSCLDDDDSSLLASLAAWSNQLRISATGVFGRVSVPILSNLADLGESILGSARSFSVAHNCSFRETWPRP